MLAITCVWRLHWSVRRGSCGVAGVQASKVVTDLRLDIRTSPPQRTEGCRTLQVCVAAADHCRRVGDTLQQREQASRVGDSTWTAYGPAVLATRTLATSSLLPPTVLPRLMSTERVCRPHPLAGEPRPFSPWFASISKVAPSLRLKPRGRSSSSWAACTAPPLPAALMPPWVRPCTDRTFDPGTWQACDGRLQA